MKKLIPALAAMLIAAPAVAEPILSADPTQQRAHDCALLLRNTSGIPQSPQVSTETFFEEAHDAEYCGRSVLEWLHDTKRYKIEPGGWSDAEVAAAVCGAQIILRYNDDTPIADALAAEFDTACGEPPAIM